MKPEAVADKARNLALIDVDQFKAGNQKNFETYMQVVAHTSPLLKRAILKAYSDAIDDTCKLLDKVKAND